MWLQHFGCRSLKQKTYGQRQQGGGCEVCACSPLMTGVNTAMPAKLGLVTVLSRIRPPTLTQANTMTMSFLTLQYPKDFAKHLIVYGAVTCWWPWRWWPAPSQSTGLLWWMGSSWLSAPTGGTWPQTLHTPVGWQSHCTLCGQNKSRIYRLDKEVVVPLHTWTSGNISEKQAQHFDFQLLL